MFDTGTLDRALRKQRRHLAVEQGELLRRVRRTLAELRKPLGVKAAYVVGSLRSPELWRESSDIDVAVAGCSSVVLELMKALEDATGKEVDVIDLDLHPDPQTFIRSGVKVYG